MRKQPLFIYEVISVRFKFYCRSLLSVKKTCFFYLIFKRMKLGPVFLRTNDCYQLVNSLLPNMMMLNLLYVVQWFSCTVVQ